MTRLRQHTATFHGETRWAGLDDDEDPLHIDLKDLGNSGGDLGGKPCGVVRGVAFTHPAGDQHRAAGTPPEYRPSASNSWKATFTKVLGTWTIDE